MAAPATPAASDLSALGGELLLDTVVASVDEKPITLSELSARLNPPRKLTVEQASSDQEARQVLDAIILEKVLEAEAQVKRVGVSDSDIEDYINEVAQRNSLSREAFEKALAEEGKSFNQYKQQVKLDILRTKLASSLTKGGVSITDKEIDDYIDEHEELHPKDNSVKLRQIVISGEGRSPEDFSARVEELKQAIEAGGNFAELAKKFSDSPEGAEGGSLGILVMDDLSGEIVEAVETLDEGEASKAVEIGPDIKFFHVEKRYSEDNDDERAESLRSEVRNSLQQQKTEERLTGYFLTELFKNHAVEKKM
jgi:peptidyl-prolyl cis-trans isomerase SurA